MVTLAHEDRQMDMTSMTSIEAMSSNITAPTHITSLQSAGILVGVRVRTTTGTVKDNEASAEIAAQKHATHGAASVSKHMLDGPEFKALKSMTSAVRNGMVRFCFRWSDDWWYVPMTRYQAYCTWETEIIKQFDERLEAFLQAYVSLRGDAAFRLGDMFKAEEYPTIEELRARFAIIPLRADVPSGDFRVTIAQDLADDLRKHYVNQTAQVIDEMVSSQREQLADVMKSLAHTCGTYQKENKKGETIVAKRKLHESTLHKALEMIDTFAKFNPAGDPMLEDARTALEQALSGVTIEALRDSDTVRARVEEDVSDILSKFRL
jgi:hypothetical protein